MWNTGDFERDTVVDSENILKLLIYWDFPQTMSSITENGPNKIKISSQQ